MEKKIWKSDDFERIDPKCAQMNEFRNKTFQKSRISEKNFMAVQNFEKKLPVFTENLQFSKLLCNTDQF
ncbi:hypothetical protein [Acidovorax sp. BLS4]|uniref:hypothetical protein n=1 Tax=Acidovorax sp. BLS4 TaxID=3273430 RepID=UPI002942CAE4|nr:hypothetical protein [Paracidovorax avenae]WOI45631.1 hypothetical protein R1Z03_24895 [Paracidovorax avenae]